MAQSARRAVQNARVPIGSPGHVAPPPQKEGRYDNEAETFARAAAGRVETGPAMSDEHAHAVLATAAIDALRAMTQGAPNGVTMPAVLDSVLSWLAGTGQHDAYGALVEIEVRSPFTQEIVTVDDLVGAEHASLAVDNAFRLRDPDAPDDWEDARAGVDDEPEWNAYTAAELAMRTLVD